MFEVFIDNAYRPNILTHCLDLWQQAASSSHDKPHLDPGTAGLVQFFDDSHIGKRIAFGVYISFFPFFSMTYLPIDHINKLHAHIVGRHHQMLECKLFMIIREKKEYIEDIFGNFVM